MGAKVSFRFVLNQGVLSTIAKACEEAALASAEVLAERSRELCPVATGALRGSCQVSGSGEEAEVSYSMPYAVIVHERPASHAVGQMKYLEDPTYDGGVHGSMLSRAAQVISSYL